VDFAHTTDGLWFVNEWVIRMPRATLRMKDGPSLPGTGIEMAVQLDGLNIAGGSVANVRANGDLVYQRGVVLPAYAAIVPVSAAMASTAGTSLEQALRQVVDTVIATITCGDRIPPEFGAIILGRVVNPDHIGLQGASVTVEWVDEPASAPVARRTVHLMKSMSILDGAYSFCGLPFDRPLAVIATLGPRRSATNKVRIAKDARRANFDLILPATSLR
jgi:hypothetical protein